MALGVHNDLKSTLIAEGDDDTEAVSVKVFFNELSVRIVTAYGPQENAIKERKDKFWEFLEKEVNDAELEGEGLIIQMDGNLDAGKNVVRKDPNCQNQNGKLFCQFLARNSNLIVVNTLEICDGVITRKRELENRTEEAILDFYIINEKMRPFVKKMQIDENKIFSLVNTAQYKKNNRLIETDHNALILDLELNFNKIKPRREEILNLKNKAGQEAFFKETEKNQELIDCFTNNQPFEAQCRQWKNIFDNIIRKCFKKIRIKPKKVETKTELLLAERMKLKQQVKLSNLDENMKMNLKIRINQIENDIGEDVKEENFKVITETVKEFGGESINVSGRKKVWQVLKNRFPKTSHSVPVGKKDSKGKIITNHEQLKQLYMKTYRQRMRNRPMKDKLKHMQDLKNKLFEVRLELSKRHKSKPWQLVHLEVVLKSLKKNKSRDPNGWINELFTDGVLGHDLKISLLYIFNKIKQENKIPDFVRLADVCTIYKGKGARNELVNERGIFVVSIMRSILMKLIYLDYYPILDRSMSDSQVGARKRKNIRNHIWIINGIIADIKNGKSKKLVDIQIFNYKQCFDGLWLQECLNDFYQAGLKDDKFAVLYNSNMNVNIAITSILICTVGRFPYPH